jgi:hypothetical protein
MSRVRLPQAQAVCVLPGDIIVSGSDDNMLTFWKRSLTSDRVRARAETRARAPEAPRQASPPP